MVPREEKTVVTDEAHLIVWASFIYINSQFCLQQLGDVWESSQFFLYSSKVTNVLSANTIPWQ